MTQTPTTIYTVGHGNRALRELITLLHGAGVQTLVDVRSFPGSRHYPHFCEENLRPALEGSGMVYHWAGRQLGEERLGKTASAHTALPTPRLRAYADHMETEVFRKGVDMLSQLAGNTVVAILGVEKPAADCHRALIADYLYRLGLAPRHLIDSATTLEHHPHPLARCDRQASPWMGEVERCREQAPTSPWMDEVERCREQAPG